MKGRHSRFLLRVLLLIVVIHMDHATAQNCGNLIQPIDANAYIQEVLRPNRNQFQSIDYTCNSGYTNGGDIGGIGTYSLTCQEGSWLTGLANPPSCDDINECLTTDCGTDAYCVNLPGSFVCVCDGSAVYDSDTGTCTDGLLCGAPPVDPCARRAEADRNPGDMAAYTCKDGYGINGDPDDNTYTITCNADTGRWSSVNNYCKDVDECAGTNSCDTNADCVNVPGSYFCRCHEGYTGNGFLCSRVTCPALPSDIPNGKLDESSGTNHQYQDNVTFDCDTGYQVNNVEGLDDDLSLLYGITRTSLSVVCTASGAWSTWPLPYCVPVSCGDPGHVANANRSAGEHTYNTAVTYSCNEGYWLKNQVGKVRYFTIRCRYNGDWDYLQECVDSSCGDPGVVSYATRSGGSFTYGSKIEYECLPGFHPRNTFSSRQGFSQTCEDDGDWSTGTDCIDIDECREYPDICGVGVNYCMNTPGSYMCSCVPWYLKDLDDTGCLDWAGLAEFDAFKPCDIVKSLGLCVNGDCALEKRHAKCRCEPGYTGIACDVRIFGTSLIVSIVGLVLTIVVIIIVCVYGFLCAGHRDIQPPVRIVVPPTRVQLPLRRSLFRPAGKLLF